MKRLFKLFGYTFLFLLMGVSNFLMKNRVPAYERPYISYAFSSQHDIDRLPIVIAHKAQVAGLPPNTLEGVEELMQSNIGGIEIDIQLSRDGVPIVFHDDLLEESTTGKGPVAVHTAAELKNMRYSETSCSIPTLEDIFKRVGNHKVLFLDIKDSNLKDSGMARAVADLIKKYNLFQSVVVETFNPIFLYRMRTYNRQILMQLDYVEDATPTEEESPEQLASIPWILKQPFFHWLVRNAAIPDLLGVRETNQQRRISELANHGYPIIAWTVDDSARAIALLKAGVLGIQTNRPFEMQEALEGVFPLEERDAGAIEKVQVEKIIEVSQEREIRDALALARREGKKISVAGAQHTMGGHTYSPGNIILKMYKYNQISYSHETKRVTVQSGATWAQVQEYLDKLGRSVFVMQSDTIFSIGGSLSANVHGWQVGQGPLASTVHQFRLMLADGEVLCCSRDENASLFRAVLGGYGLFGVILDAEIETVPNKMLTKKSRFFPAEKFPKIFDKMVTADAELVYGRFSTASNQLLTEASLNVYEASDEMPVESLSEEKLVGFKRRIFRLSERSDRGKRIRWLAEKNISRKIEKKQQSRNNAMHPDIRVLWQQSMNRRDTLQEYFIPKDRYPIFIEALRQRVLEHEVNLLNVTVREVRSDVDTLLAYARQDSFAFVLLFSQGIEEQEKMKIFTQAIIEDVLAMGGTFYLPYRLDYRLDQFCRAYPMYREFIELKKRFDPEELFTSQFWDYIKPSYDRVF